MSTVDITGQSRAEEPTRRQPELLNLSHDSILVRDISGVILFWNHRSEELYGWKKEEVLGKRVRDILHSEYPESEEAILDVVSREDHWDGELWHTCRDGRRICVESRWAMQRDARGVALAIIEINSDITARKKVQEELRESENRLRSILDNSTSIIFLKDVEGRYIYVNPSFRKICNLPSDQVLGKTDAELFPPAQASSFRSNDLEVLRTGNPLDCEETAAHADGLHTSVVNKFPLRDQGGATYAVCGIVTDITPQKRSEARFRNLLESAPDAIVIVDSRRKIVLVNGQTESLFGYNRKELIGREVDTLIPARYRKAQLEYWRGYFNSPRLRPMGGNLELYARRKDGREFPVEISLSPLESAEGSMVSAGIRDISGRKEAEQALRDLSRDLLRARDDERRRVARELHDTTGQKVAALTLQLGTLRTRAAHSAPDLAALAQECEDTSKQLSRELRALSYLLHPPVLDEMGLIPAIQWLIDGLQKRAAFTVDLESPAHFPRLPEDFELALFRTIQEALTNFVLHSNGSSASVRISLNEKGIEIEVSDRRKPSPKRSVRPFASLGVGITSMKERITQLNGNFKVAFTDSGTIVHAAIPFRRSTG